MPPCRNNSLPNETASDEGKERFFFSNPGPPAIKASSMLTFAVACIIQLQGSCFSWLKGGRIVTDNT